MNAPYDVAIAGGGPAGAMLAYLLARNGRRVLVLEASESEKRKICGEYLCPKAVELLHKEDLAKVLEGRPVRGMRLFSPGGIAVNSTFPGGESGLAVRRDRLDPALLESARSAGAEIVRGCRLESFQTQGGIWELKSSKEKFRARVLVGADGRHSLVARSLGVQVAPKNKRVAVHFFANLEEETSEFGEMHVLPDGSYVGISPTSAKELNVSIVCDTDKAKEGGRAAVEILLAQSSLLKSRFLPLPANTLVSVAYPVTHQVRSVAGPSWALVGDAAGFLDPLTGEGMYQALLSASLLAHRLRETFDGANLTEGLSAYCRDYKRCLGGKTTVNRFFQTLIRHPSACDWVGKRLRANPARANAFIGIIGNVTSPAAGIKQIVFSSRREKSAQ